MKTKKIIIKSREEMHKEELAFAKKLDHGEKVRPVRGEYFESAEAVRIHMTNSDLASIREEGKKIAKKKNLKPKDVVRIIREGRSK